MIVSGLQFLCNIFVQKNYWKHFPSDQQTEKQGP